MPVSFGVVFSLGSNSAYEYCVLIAHEHYFTHTIPNQK
jgi:hypothetical protein